VHRRAKASPVVCGLAALLALGSISFALTGPAEAASNAPLADQVAYLGSPASYDVSIAVVPGSTVSLHWGGGSTPLLSSGVHLLVTSTVPHFSSAAVAQWPGQTSPTPKWNGTGWVTTATGMSVTIPAGAAPGTHFRVTIRACVSNYCAKPKRTTLAVPSSSTTWRMRPYAADFSKVATFSAPGSPFATTFLTSNDSIWSASEYSHDITGIQPTAKLAAALLVPDPAGAPSAFQNPFAYCGVTNCEPSSKSALSEQVITSHGWIWATFGGWRVYADGQRDDGAYTSGQPATVSGQSMPPNQSEVVAFDPATRHFCTYLVPGNNTQVAGIAAIGAPPHTQIWFVASDGPSGEGSLDEFNPSTVGGGCNGRTDEDYVLPTSVKRLSWPQSGAQWPVQIAADPSSPTLWITDFNGYSGKDALYSGIDRIDISRPSHPRFVRRYEYRNQDSASVFGAKPWDIVAPRNSDYVYATDNGDAEIVRINKATNQLQEVPIPLTTDLENAFGLAISSGRLYFALADDFKLLFGAASTFGYINLSSWPADGPPASGVIYSGLEHVTDPQSFADYRAIAVGPSGQVALTDSSGIVRLSPKHRT
jgi:hypothetical protein